MNGNIEKFKQTPEGQKVYDEALNKDQKVINAENQLHLSYMAKTIDEQKQHCSKVTGEIFPRLNAIEDYSAEKRGSLSILKVLVLSLILTIFSLLASHFIPKLLAGIN